MLRVEADPKADAVYIQLLDDPISHSVELDENRVVDYGPNSRPVGVGLLSVSDGVKVDGLPEIEKIRTILGGLDITVTDRC